jgi:hypothetical protein
VSGATIIDADMFDMDGPSVLMTGTHSSDHQRRQY